MSLLFDFYKLKMESIDQGPELILHLFRVWIFYLFNFNNLNNRTHLFIGRKETHVPYVEHEYHLKKSILSFNRVDPWY